MTIGLILACVVLYFIGGQSWAETRFRDLGCGICITGLAWFIFGWSWPFFAIIPLVYAGCSIGDHGPAFWTEHAFVIGLSMLPYAIVNHDYLCFVLMVTSVVGGTYVVSRWLNKFGIDVIGRGLLYATIPLWFLIR